MTNIYTYELLYLQGFGAYAVFRKFTESLNCSINEGGCAIAVLKMRMDKLFHPWLSLFLRIKLVILYTYYSVDNPEQILKKVADIPVTARKFKKDGDICNITLLNYKLRITNYELSYGIQRFYFRES